MSFDDSPRPPDSTGRAARVPPHNADAEASLIGAMLLSRDAIGPAVELLDGDQFYVPAHGYIFDAIASLYGAGEPADPVTVAEELTRSGLLDQVGGPQRLLELQMAKPPEGRGSWFIGDLVKQDGSVQLVSEIDPIFLVAPLLATHANKRVRAPPSVDVAPSSLIAAATALAYALAGQR